MLHVETLVTNLSAGLAALVANSVPAHPWTRYVDWTIRISAIAGAIIILVVVIARAWRGQKLAFVERPNQFRAETIIATLAAYLLASLILFQLLRLLPIPWPEERLQLVAAALGQCAGIITCCLFASIQFGGGVKQFIWGRPTLRWSRLVPIVLITSILAIGICEGIVVMTIEIIKYFAPGHVFRPHQTIQALRAVDQPSWVIVLLWLSSVVFAPLLEEPFFRGLTQTFVATATRRSWFAITFTSVFFALVHWTQTETVPAIFLLGVFLGYVYERTGALAPVILIHMLFNLRTMIWVSLGVSDN